MKKKGSKRGNLKQKLFAALNVLLLILSLLCLGAARLLTRVPDAQQAAERWRGENDQPFSQVSCFLAEQEKLSLDQVYQFRQNLQTSLHEAALDLDTETALFEDAWSTTGKVSVRSALGSGEASAIAVGGSFFNFHPLRLLSGSYLTESDLMKDRVLLDEDLAWLLFGGNDLQGMEMTVNGQRFIVGGVIERENDFASRKAYTAGMGLYMSFEAFAQLNETAGVSCYELVAAEPVEGFVRSAVEKSFPIGAGEIVENSARYTLRGLLRVIGGFGTRSMQTLGVIYPYWENAARLLEDWSALLLLLGALGLLLPVFTAVWLLLRLLRRGKDKLTGEVLPKMKDGVEEAVRVRQRKHWEKKHGRHENKK